MHIIINKNNWPVKNKLKSEAKHSVAAKNP